MTRTFSILMSIMLAASMQAQKIHWLPESKTQNYQGVSISPNGKFIAGFNAYMQVSEGQYNGTNNGFIWSIAKNKAFDTSSDQVSGSTMSDVSDNGKAVGYSVSSSGDPYNPNVYAATLNIDDGKITNIENLYSIAYGVSSDGSVVVGYIKEDDVKKACLWMNGERVLLPLPTATEADVTSIDGSEAIYVSNAGNVILGKITCQSPITGSDRTYSVDLVLAWKKQADGSYACDLVFKDIFDQKSDKSKPFTKAVPSGLSDNGEWISLQTRGGYENEEGLWVLDLVDRFTRMNLSTREYETALLKGSESLVYNYPCKPGGIANDGTMVGAYGLDNSRKALIWCAEAEEPEILSDKYGFEDINSLVISQATDISADGSRVVGFGKTEAGLSRTFWIETGRSDVSVSSLTGAGKELSTSIFSVDGKRINTNSIENLPHGLYIIQTSDGKNVDSRKMVVK